MYVLAHKWINFGQFWANIFSIRRITVNQASDVAIGYRVRLATWALKRVKSATLAT